MRQIFPAEHPDTLQAQSNLASWMFKLRDSEGARDLLQTTMDTTKGVLGAEHTQALQAQNNLAAIL